MTKTTIGDHAIVLGASMAGLLTARVLAKAYTRVTVIERDILPLDMGHRRGVPHGLHLHGLHAGGRQVLDELFPGFTEQVAAAGAEVGDSLGTLRWQLSGQRLRQVDIGLPGLATSRPFLEGQIRQRVRALPSVNFVEGRDVAGLVTDSERGRVTGVRVVERDGGGMEGPARASPMSPR
jgi:2-polyprenyl-6-methoxyphenol hydroxylase-like FAD-dependent oxidoreductase